MVADADAAGRTPTNRGDLGERAAARRFRLWLLHVGLRRRRRGHLHRAGDHHPGRPRVGSAGLPDSRHRLRAGRALLRGAGFRLSPGRWRAVLHAAWAGRLRRPGRRVGPGPRLHHRYLALHRRRLWLYQLLPALDLARASHHGFHPDPGADPPCLAVADRVGDRHCGLDLAQRPRHQGVDKLQRGHRNHCDRCPDRDRPGRLCLGVEAGNGR